MSADKLALPVTAQMSANGTFAELHDADGALIGSVATFTPPIPADIALRAAEAAAAVINEALTPAWTWGPGRSTLHRRFYHRGTYRGFAEATDEMAQAMCDGLNAAGVEP